MFHAIHPAQWGYPALSPVWWCATPAPDTVEGGMCPEWVTGRMSPSPGAVEPYRTCQIAGGASRAGWISMTLRAHCRGGARTVGLSGAA